MLKSSGLILEVVLAVAVSGCNIAQAPDIATSTVGRCTNSNGYISVGGIGGFNALVNRNFTTALLSTGHVRLYEHANAIASAIADSPRSNPFRILNAIETIFSETGPGEAELGYVGANYFTLPAKEYPAYYQYQYVSSGLTPNAANVNVPDRPPWAITFDQRNVRAWKLWVQAGRSVGISSMAPIVAPNAAWKPHSHLFPPTRREYYDLNSPFYDLARYEASYGGGIALDTPPNFFLTGGSGRGYQHFIEQGIRWGNAQGIRTTVLISPYPGRREFSHDTKEFVRALLAQGAVPTEWAVDDYENANPHDTRAMGPDTRANTTTNVGLWLARHAPVFGCDERSKTAPDEAVRERRQHK
ncbi:MAG: hypothetical protein WCB01_04910 [Candidatus Cybelea sp.]